MIIRCCIGPRSRTFNRKNPCSSENSASGTPPAQVLQKVVIPTSRSSLGSSLSSSLDHSTSENEYTPATSVAVTPAEPALKRQKPRTLVAAGHSVSRTSTSTESKRKRETDDHLAEADELLAQSLQEREWNVSTEQQSPALKRSRMQILDSDSEGLSSIESFEHESILDASQAIYSKRQAGTNFGRPKGQARGHSHTKISKDSCSGDSLSEDDSSSNESAFTPEQDGNPESSEASDSLDGDRPEPTNHIFASNLSTEEILPTRPNNQSARRARTSQASVRRSRRRGQGREDRATRERKKLTKAHPEITSMWDDLRAIPRIQPSQRSQPISITRKLKSFQLEGLDWMLKQEKSQWKGGLLGDEMGMGKTIQAVSLIMSDHPAKDPTLVVVPPVALLQWQNEIERYTDGKLQVLIYHNTNPKVKNMSLKDLRGFDVIMISYSGLESVYRKESKGWKRDDGLVKENSKIHALHYHRLILDEAHSIKTRTTSVAKACFALKANYKWCLSGTPVQNRIGEFFSLLRFLQIVPFASYFCKKCPCARLHWSQDTEKRCSNCHHTGFEHVSVFNQELLNPITQQADPELRREGLQKLRLITDRIMLRRMKRDHTASMELPPKNVFIHNEFFGEIERDFSSSIMSNTARQFDTYVSRGVMLNNYANIFGLIMQVCF